MHFINALYLLVIGFLSARVGFSIRVDWNTNKGPIIPPTPRTTQRPELPYREPAPVWEDQSNDIPNPNPYVYVLPPPSRPRPATNNYLTADRRPVTQENYYLYNNQNNYGSLLPAAQNSADYYQRANGIVAGLSPKFIPNFGFKYFAIVPNNRNNYNNNNNGNAKSINSLGNGLSNGYYNGDGYGSGRSGSASTNDKLQGKYNAKTKKYKAYEKVKYVPPNYYPNNEFALSEMISHRYRYRYRPIFNHNELLIAQQLPATEIAVPLNNLNNIKYLDKNIENFAQNTDEQRQLQLLNEMNSISNPYPVEQQNQEGQQQQQQERQHQEKEGQQTVFISKVAYSKDAGIVNEKPSKLNMIKQRKDNGKSSYATKSSNSIKLNTHKDGVRNDIATTIHTIIATNSNSNPNSNSNSISTSNSTSTSITYTSTNATIASATATTIASSNNNNNNNKSNNTSLAAKPQT